MIYYQLKREAKSKIRDTTTHQTFQMFDQTKVKTLGGRGINIGKQLFLIIAKRISID